MLVKLESKEKYQDVMPVIYENVSYAEAARRI